MRCTRKRCVIGRHVLVRLFSSPYVRGCGGIFISGSIICFGLGGKVTDCDGGASDLDPALRSTLSLDSIATSSSSGGRGHLPLSKGIRLRDGCQSLLFSMDLPRCGGLSMRFRCILRKKRNVTLASSLGRPRVHCNDLSCKRCAFRTRTCGSLKRGVNRIRCRFTVTHPFCLSCCTFTLCLVILATLICFFSG